MVQVGCGNRSKGKGKVQRLCRWVVEWKERDAVQECKIRCALRAPEGSGHLRYGNTWDKRSGALAKSHGNGEKSEEALALVLVGIRRR